MIGSVAPSRPLIGDARPSGETSCGKPGSSVLFQFCPPSTDLNSPTQASAFILKPRIGSNGPGRSTVR